MSPLSSEKRENRAVPKSISRIRELQQRSSRPKPRTKSRNSQFLLTSTPRFNSNKVQTLVANSLIAAINARSLLSSQRRTSWSRGWATFNACGSRGPSSAAAIPCGGRTRRCSIRRAWRCTPIGRVRTWPRPPRSCARRSRTSSDRPRDRSRVPARARELTSRTFLAYHEERSDDGRSRIVVEFFVAISSVFLKFPWNFRRIFLLIL